MIGRTQTKNCSGCQAPLVVPPSASIIRCSSCGAVTLPHHHHHHLGSALQAAGWIKGIFANASRALSSSSAAHRNTPAPSHGHGSETREPVPRPLSYPSVHGSKRALLCGVNYIGRRYELKGSVNDVNCMKFLLCERFGFPSDSILVLTEEERDPSRVPTKENMRAAMRWLVRECRAGDSLVFQFSGHGSQKLDVTADEDDGYDETLCPVDYEANGVIEDDEINATIVRPLPIGAKLHAIVDACHSGTVLDLTHVCRMSRSGVLQWKDCRPPSGVYKGTNGGLAICFSACDDHQTSADTSALSRSVSTGAMTYSFIHALESEPGPTYGRILNVMRSVIHGADTGLHFSGQIASLVRRMFSLGFTQEAQLSSSETFDVYRRPFLL